MVHKCQTTSSDLLNDEKPKLWKPNSLEVEKKNHGFLIVPTHPRAIATQEARREAEQQAQKKEQESKLSEKDLQDSFDKGYKKAQEELKKGFEEQNKALENEVQMHRDKVLSLVDTLGESLESYKSDIEKNIKEIALRFLKGDQKKHLELIEQNIKKYLKTHKIYKIYVSDEAHGKWCEFLPEYTDLFVAKSHLSDLECVINFDDFFLDGRFEALLQNSDNVQED